MSQHESKSGGGATVVIVIVGLVFLLFVIPCGLLALGSAFYLGIESPPAPAPVRVQDLELAPQQSVPAEESDAAAPSQDQPNQDVP